MWTQEAYRPHRTTMMAQGPGKVPLPPPEQTHTCENINSHRTTRVVITAKEITAEIYGVIILDDTGTDNETYELLKPMASLILSRCSVKCSTYYSGTHNYRCRSRYRYRSRCRPVWTDHNGLILYYIFSGHCTLYQSWHSFHFLLFLAINSHIYFFSFSFYANNYHIYFSPAYFYRKRETRNIGLDEIC